MQLHPMFITTLITEHDRTLRERAAEASVQAARRPSGPPRPLDPLIQGLRRVLEHGLRPRRAR